eukprot:gene11781-3488_t
MRVVANRPKAEQTIKGILSHATRFFSANEVSPFPQQTGQPESSEPVPMVAPSLRGKAWGPDREHAPRARSFMSRHSLGLLDPNPNSNPIPNLNPNLIPNPNITRGPRGWHKTKTLWALVAWGTQVPNRVGVADVYRNF